ncbi:MAG: hypothetical protein JW724_02405 [Candidatus Altiarchaeota archaeon]|nr:hypothetical protein [Candidatus Altiarchaeota archaeon]
MKAFFALFFLAMVYGMTFSVHPQSGESSKGFMRADAKGFIDGLETEELCVNEKVRVKVMNLYSYRPLNRVSVRVYYGKEFLESFTTGFDGIIEFVPEKEGIYEVYMEKTGYRDAGTKLNMSSCSVDETTSTTIRTTTSITTLSTERSTTSSAVPSTAAPTLTTLPEESCTDAVQNHGEEGIDCGGPCKSCTAGRISGGMLIMLLSVLFLAFGLLAFFLLKGRRGGSGKKPKRAKKKKTSNKD